MADTTRRRVTGICNLQENCGRLGLLLQIAEFGRKFVSTHLGKTKMVQLAESTLTDFVENTHTHVSSLRGSKNAEVLTIEGEPALVVQDAEAYQELLALAEQGRDDLRLQAALSDFQSGERGEPADVVFDRLRAKYADRM